MKTKLKRLIGSIAAAAMIAACTAVSVSASAVGTTYNSNANFPELTTDEWTTDHTWDNVWEAEIYNSTDDAYYQTYYHYNGGFANGWYWSSSIVKGDKFVVEQEDENALTKHPVRTFNAPITGELTIDAATITHYFNSELTFNIKKNTETLWTASVNEWGTTAQPMLTVNVKEGDKIRFEVIQTQKGTYGYEIEWTNNVNLAPSRGKYSYNSNIDFPANEPGWTGHKWMPSWEAEIYDSSEQTYSYADYTYNGGFAINSWDWFNAIVKGDKLTVSQGDVALTKHPVRTFNAPITGELTIDAATITHYFDSGLTFNIKKNTETLWTTSVNYYGETAQPSLTVKVNAGDKIRFEVIQTEKGTYGYEIGWTNDLEYTSLLSDYVQKAEYTCENGTVSFSYERGPKADDADIYAVVYDSSKLPVYLSVNRESGSYNGDASEDYTLKLFAWDKNVSMKPLCEPIVLKQYNYNPSPVTVSADMKANFLGDSITQGAGTSKAYLYYLADKLNVSHDNFRNYGMSGTELARDNQYGESFIKRAANMNNDADIVFCLGGTNDFGENAGYVDLGSTDDLYLAPSFCGGFNRLCRVLLEKYPDKQIVILTPVKREYTGTTSGGFTLEQFVNAEIEIANRYGIPVIDMYHAEELDFETLGWDEYAPDGLHPNDNGHKLMADYIYDQIINMGIID